jgi:hypothetical protein
VLGRNATAGLDAIDGNGALLRVASGKAVTITRNNADRNLGDLLIESGATLQGVGALQLDSTRNMNVSGLLKVGTVAGKIHKLSRWDLQGIEVSGSFAS